MARTRPVAGALEGPERRRDTGELAGTDGRAAGGAVAAATGAAAAARRRGTGVFAALWTRRRAARCVGATRRWDTCCVFGRRTACDRGSAASGAGTPATWVRGASWAA